MCPFMSLSGGEKKMNQETCLTFHSFQEVVVSIFIDIRFMEVDSFPVWYNGIEVPLLKEMVMERKDIDQPWRKERVTKTLQYGISIDGEYCFYKIKK